MRRGVNTSMTQALCLNCGDIKFGALCPCPACEVTSTGNIELDITFSDHNYSEETLREFGQLIKALKEKTEDDPVAFWGFMRFISENHSNILSANVPEEIQDRVDELYQSVELPKISIEEVEEP